MTKPEKTEAQGIDAKSDAEKTQLVILPDPLAKQREEALAKLKSNCGNCRCAHFPFDDPDSWGECRYEPPRMQIIATPPKIAGQGPLFQPMSAWPPIQRVQFCIMGFQPKPKLQQ